ncbi:DNA/RNA non-specific endonuclease [Aquimarina longa]|uniref:DNA/RNA non-specific endonuclease n=1 Tax=Aquimarina longa TaxID=1080221 RepID=UPI000783E937|nr:DNA/RNA non-specific endonuclease [Aquimarina longa]
MNIRKYIYPILIIIISIGFYYFEGYLENNKNYSDDKTGGDTSEVNFFYLPTSTTGAIIVHDNYSLSYSEKHEQAEWVAYQLKKEHLSTNQFKRPYFEEDKKVKSLSSDWRNYKKSGYDKGHLCPAGDRRYTKEAFNETFLTSNITPQNHEFNSKIWNYLEQKTRSWAKLYDGVYVVTGGVLSDGLSTIGYEQVSVPEYFYKIIFNNSSGKPKIIAFLMPHKDSRKSLKEFVVSVDEVEKLTGIDFFPTLDDAIENQIESSITIKDWKF